MTRTRRARQLWRLCLAVYACGCVAGVAGAAHAQAAVQLEVAPGDALGCLTEAALRAELDMRYARPVIPSPTSDILVRVESAGAGQAIVRFTRGNAQLGTRHFTALPRACDIQRTVISVAILVALDEIARLDPGAQLEGPVEANVTAPAAPQRVASQPTDERPAATTRVWQLSMSVALERDLVPGWGAGGRARLTTQLRHGLSLRMEGWGAGSRNVELGDRNVRIRLLAVGPGICMSWSNATVALPLCVGVLAGIAIARGDPGQPESRVTWLPWSAATLHGSVRLLPRRTVGPILSVDSFVHAVRPRLTAQDESGATIAARTWPRGGASVSLGAEVRLH